MFHRGIYDAPSWPEAGSPRLAAYPQRADHTSALEATQFVVLGAHHQHSNRDSAKLAGAGHADCVRRRANRVGGRRRTIGKFSLRCDSCALATLIATPHSYPLNHQHDTVVPGWIDRL